MNFVSDYVRKIADFLLINAVVSVLIPNSSFKVYINMIMGMILVALILSPIASIFNLS
jgi:stage III sporulation protein AF